LHRNEASRCNTNKWASRFNLMRRSKFSKFTRRQTGRTNLKKNEKDKKSEN